MIKDLVEPIEEDMTMKKVIITCSLGVVAVIVAIIFLWPKAERENKDWTVMDYAAMNPSQQESFRDSFDSYEDFEEWQNMQTEIELPWELDNRDPWDYTLEEYEALDPELKQMFTDSFPSIQGFEAWLEANQSTEEPPFPWELNGIAPKNYSMEAYEALNFEEKEAFKATFSSTEEFEAWLEQKNGSGEIQLPWVELGIDPKDYPYEDFEILTIEQRDAFVAAFPSLEEFEAWLAASKPIEDTGNFLDNKPVEEYTWEEFEALSLDEKNAFMESFASDEQFEAWMDEVKP